MTRRRARLVLTCSASMLAVMLGLAPAAAQEAQTPAAAARALQTQDPAAVTAAVQQVVAASVPADSKVTLGAVQGARFMPACPLPLGVVMSGVEPYEQAAVSCPKPAWTLYVTVTVAATQLVAVAARPITPGQVIGPADIRIAREPVALYAGRQVFYDKASAIGGTAVMGLPAGAILTSDDVSAPVVVQAGQTVTVAVETGNVTVSVNAIADQQGRVGETIVMTNPGSGKHFEALVTRGGLVVSLQ
jgi:flagella basal body P-ring formation protein FlgA